MGSTPNVRRKLNDAAPAEWSASWRAAALVETASATPTTALQVGGTHYKGKGIQPIEYIHSNGIPFAEGCVIKYVTRWRKKGGLEDLRKAKHFIEMLIELESVDGKSVDGSTG